MIPTLLAVSRAPEFFVPFFLLADDALRRAKGLWDKKTVRLELKGVSGLLAISKENREDPDIKKAAAQFELLLNGLSFSPCLEPNAKLVEIRDPIQSHDTIVKLLQYKFEELERNRAEASESDDLDEKGSDVAASPVDIVRHLCERFPMVARQLQDRARDKVPLKLDDEYDVQYLLNALLALHFDDVRPEEPTPSHAGAWARMDFLLKAERLVLEVKMTRTSLSQRDLGEELIIDVAKYAKHQDCDVLVCFVYDPLHRVTNRAALIRDIEGHDGRLPVHVVIAP